MRVVVQRVRRAEARQDGAVVGAIGGGLVVMVGFGRDDDEAVAARMAHKLAHLRVFEHGDSKFGRSVLEDGGEVLTVSQFPVMADTSRGRRPSFSRAAPTEQARALYGAFVGALRDAGLAVADGPFQARLEVDLTCWGPFTLTLDSDRPTG